MPSATEDYYPFNSQNNKKVKNRNRAEYEWPANNMPAYGWLDTNQNIWVPSGPSEHGGPHWNVENIDGTHTCVFSTRKRLLFDISTITLVCTNVVLYSTNDEDIFFEWIKKIGCVEGLTGSENTVYLHLSSDELFESDFEDLCALFYRYGINMEQLQKFSPGGKILRPRVSTNIYPNK